jgi:exosortase/archaeosortase family protein
MSEASALTAGDPAIRCAPLTAPRPPFRTAWPAVLLGLEAGALTPFVEFSGGAMEHVASGRVCSALLVALVALFLLNHEATSRAVVRAASRRWDLGWGLIHFTLYGILFILTLRLQALTPASAGVVPAAMWLVVVLAVGATAFLAFNGHSGAGGGCDVPVYRGLAALSLGGVFALLSPWALACWPPLSRPALALGRTLLDWTHPGALGGVSAAGCPYLGTPGLVVLVTPQCSEMDALLAFWLLGGAALAARHREVRPWRALTAAVAGTAFFYLLNAVRLYGLVLVALEVSPEACVRLAHSRLSQLAFLGLTAALAAGPLRWYALAPAVSRAEPNYA